MATRLQRSFFQSPPLIGALGKAVIDERNCKHVWLGFELLATLAELGCGPTVSSPVHRWDRGPCARLARLSTTPGPRRRGSAADARQHRPRLGEGRQS